jgi:hypothetical protein
VMARPTGPGSVKTMDDASSIAESRKSSRTMHDASSIADSIGLAHSEDNIASPKVAQVETNWPIITVNENASPAGRPKSINEPQEVHVEPVVPEKEITTPELQPLPMVKPDISVDTTINRSRPTSIEVSRQSMPLRKAARNSVEFQSRGLDRASTMDVEATLDLIEEGEESDAGRDGEHPRVESAGSSERTPVDWDKLDKTEEHLEGQTATEDDGDEVKLLMYLH